MAIRVSSKREGKRKIIRKTTEFKQEPTAKYDNGIRVFQLPS